MPAVANGQKLAIQDGERLVGFDNAHPVGKQKRGAPRDHHHRLRTIKAYEYHDAASLLADFWKLDELAQITGRAKSNLSPTLKTMAGYGLVRLERGDKGRITPKVTHDRVELDLPLTESRNTEQKRKLG